MNAERVTFSAGVPTVWLGLLQHLRATGTRLDTVKRVACGGAAVPSAVIEAFRTEYGVRVEHAWGMTETSPIGTYNTPKQVHRSLSEDEAAGLRAKQGRVPFGFDIKIVGGSGEELPWDGVAFGDLLARGPWVAGGYFKQAPGSALGTDGWFATGDVASIDADGVMEITDRSKDVIKSGGEWISSIALENIAMAHPDVAEAAVIAARHEKWTERPLLLVVAKAGRSIEKASLLASYEGLVAKWWLPDEVLVVADLPHTATGKLQKSALRAQYRDYLVSGGPVAVQS
jgi:fatty-acyl-CoA synthase